jgi:hypothetical protein
MEISYQSIDRYLMIVQFNNILLLPIFKSMKWSYDIASSKELLEKYDTYLVVHWLFIMLISRLSKVGSNFGYKRRIVLDN